MLPAPELPYSAVLDTCVLAPMPLCDILLRCAEAPAFFRPWWSEEILIELRCTLLKFGMTEEKADYRIRSMWHAFPEATVIVGQQPLSAIIGLPDSFDRHVVAAAILAKANVIVTGNLKHFPTAALVPHRLSAQSPDQFLLHLYRLNPEIMLEKIDNQASAIGQSRAAIAERLKSPAPGFAQAVRDRKGP